MLSQLNEIQTSSTSNLIFTTVNDEFTIANNLIQTDGNKFHMASNVTQNVELLAIVNLPCLIWIKLLHTSLNCI